MSAINFESLLGDSEETAKGTNKCALGKVLETIPEDIRVKFAAIINTSSSEGGETDNQVWQRLNRSGFKISEASVNRHRSNRCICLF
jgi:hypothetical protein